MALVPGRVARGVRAALIRHSWQYGLRQTAHPASSSASSRAGIPLSWGIERTVGHRASSSTSGSRARPSRNREVEAACAALAESVEVGDSAWFERIISQLREVLDEAEARAASPKILGGPERPQPQVRKETQQPFERLESSPPNSGVWTPAAPSPAASVKPEPAEEGEPAWLQALRLLEAAANAPLRGRATAPSVPPPPPTPGGPARGTTGVARGASQPQDKSDEQVDVEIGEYLASFEENGPAPRSAPDRAPTQSSEEAEPAWARALRLLDAIPGITGGNKGGNNGGSSGSSGSAGGGGGIMLASENAPESVANGAHEHAGEDERMGRYEQLLGGVGASTSRSQPSGDARQNLRMQRYEELLQEVDGIGKLAPGASVPPVRFGGGTLGMGVSSETRQPTTSSPPPSSSSHPSTASATPRTPPIPPSLSTVSGNGTNDSKKRSSSGKKPSSATDPFAQAVGRGNLVRASPGPMPDELRDDAELRKEDFVWSEHQFNDGEKENKRVLRGFRKKFKQMVEDTPEGMRNARLLTAALDFALACVKAYELDKADAVYRRVIGECRRRGMPWDVKCIQDMATLRCKQHRQADAAELLEELVTIAPPHPATFINLGTVYNQLRQYEKAESWFLQAVNLKGGTPGREDHWNLGIAKKNMGKYDEALPMLEQALAEFQVHEPDGPVTLAKLHSSVAGCLHDMGRPTDAIEQYENARELYVGTVGTSSPLFCSAVEGLAKSMWEVGRFEDAFDSLLDAFRVHAINDAVHPTPLFEDLELALKIHDARPTIPLDRLAPLIDAGIDNLDKRGMATDGNAGLVMSRGGKVLSRLTTGDHSRRAAELVHRGLTLIRQSHEAGEADLSHEILQAEMLLRSSSSLKSDSNQEMARFPSEGARQSQASM